MIFNDNWEFAREKRQGKNSIESLGGLKQQSTVGKTCSSTWLEQKMLSGVVETKKYRFVRINNTWYSTCKIAKYEHWSLSSQPYSLAYYLITKLSHRKELFVIWEFDNSYSKYKFYFTKRWALIIFFFCLRDFFLSQEGKGID